MHAHWYQLLTVQEVHSFDLVATAPGVVACNMAAVPLDDASIDAAIFCLALMGTDYGSFLQVLHQLQFIPAHAADHEVICSDDRLSCSCTDTALDFR